jgi:RbsD / FucU transport protein family
LHATHPEFSVCKSAKLNPNSKKPMKNQLLTLFTLCLLAVPSVHASEPWQDKLQQQLPLLGHRNWIVVVDSAYPLQTAPGIETIYSSAGQTEVVKEVIAALAKTQHVKPTIYLDAEMKFVAEKDAPGISTYRDDLKAILGKQPAVELPHEEIIAKLDEAGKTFKVLIIKTPLTKPYTSVFFQLECGYWNADAEQCLRDAMKAAE